MPGFKTFVPGETLTSADLMSYLMRQAVIQCTSSTRPGSPHIGMTIYETDTHKMLTYAGATSGWCLPWNAPWGRIASTAVGGRAAAGGTADVGSLNFTAVANRIYKVTSSLTITPAAASTFEVRILVDGVAKGGGFAGTSENHIPAHAMALVSGLSAGTRTVVLDTAVVSGGDVGVQPSTSGVGIPILVEDVGPSGAPS